MLDELDLHLHPNWQRSLVGDLRRIFPNLQFIVTSHSPFLLQAAYEHGKVLDVASGHFVAPTDHSIEDIAESVMGISQPQRGQKSAITATSTDTRLGAKPNSQQRIWPDTTQCRCAP